MAILMLEIAEDDIASYPGHTPTLSWTGNEAKDDIAVQLQEYAETEQQEIKVRLPKVICDRLRFTLRVCDPPNCKSRKCSIKRRALNSC